MDYFEEKIAIIGGGPAGLTAAFYLAEKGYRPTVFEKMIWQAVCFVMEFLHTN